MHVIQSSCSESSRDSGRLNFEDQSLLAPLIALAMRSFLENDANSLACDLGRFGYSKEDSLLIAQQSIATPGALNSVH